MPLAAPITTDVPAPAKFTVVALVLARLKVVVDTVKSPPSILTSPSTSRLFLTLVVPVAAPILTAVPAPAKFTVVAVVFNKLNVTTLVVMSPPLTARSPDIAVLALLIVVVPVAAPILTVVPAPNKLPVVAVALNTVAVVEVVVISPPLTAKSPVKVVAPATAKSVPTYNFFATAIPPAVYKDAAVSDELVASVVPSICASS